MKSLTIRLRHVNRCRLPGWGLRDNRNKWLETFSDMAENRWPGAFIPCLPPNPRFLNSS
uniref:SJCHGC03133 protein n=1 Tax=Schistosoma japonicum TaxID=6182 RepID=Q5BSW2_SCHJA|nr:SJCHGC03133 protein [Schistosoma japonicum]